MRFSSLRDALRLGAACMLVGAGGWAWDCLVRQAPSSRWHIRGYPSAVDRFALTAWIIGIVVFAVAPRAWDGEFARRPSRARIVVLAAHLGAICALAALAYAASTGELGMQLRDRDATTGVLIALRWTGDAALLGALLAGLRASLARN